MIELVAIIIILLIGNIYQIEVIIKKNEQIKKQVEFLAKCRTEYTKMHKVLKTSDLNYLLKQHKAVSKRLSELQGKVCTPNEHLEKTGLEYVRSWLDIRIEEMK